MQKRKLDFKNLFKKAYIESQKERQAFLKECKKDPMWPHIMQFQVKEYPQ